MQWKWLPLGLFVLSPLSAETINFVETTGLLDNSDVAGGVFRSANAVGVVDMNGDRKDDIIRTHLRRGLRMEFQTTPNAAFGHLNLGALDDFLGSWCMMVADADGNGINDMVIGEAYSGHNLYLANATGTSFAATHLNTDVDLSQDGLFGDLDNDGAIDVFVCDDDDDLHKWQGAGDGSFVFDSDNSLIDTLLTAVGSEDNGGNYAIIQTDFDRDGDSDYYLSKCRQGVTDSTELSRINRLFVNDGAGNYTEDAATAGLASGAQTWCADFGDIDNDGDLDCFLLNHQSGSSTESALLENNGSGVFTEVTTAAGLNGAIDELGNQALFRDFNNDGWVDLLVASLNDDDDSDKRTYWFFENDQDGTFTRREGVFLHADGTSEVELIHTFAVGDLNGDGFLDLYAGRGKNINGPSSSRFDLLLLNEGNSNGYLSITLVGSTSNPNGIGARIEAIGAWGTQVREVRGGEGYGIMNSLNAHFGLGTATEVPQLKITWPSGAVDDILAVPGNRAVVIYEGTGAVAMTYADWIEVFFPAGGPDADEDADPDGDGVPNLVEQLRGTDPKAPNGGPGLVATVEEDGGQTYLRVAMARMPMLDVTLRMEFSETETGWSTPAGLEVLEDSFLIYEVRLPINPATQPFMMARLVADLTGP